MTGSKHQAYLADALVELLGEPTQGAVAFLRCLPSYLVDTLVDAADFVVPGWIVNAVVDTAGPRRITADQAVEQREDKSDPALFLVDPLRAGAGLDGIYSASREIKEAELFDKARILARKPLREKTFLDIAVRSAERLGRRRRLTPWQIFDFYVATEANGHGAAVGRLGLWPIMCDRAPDKVQLGMAEAMANRLLFAQDALTVADRVRALLLDDPTGEQARSLEQFLHGVAGKPPLEAAHALGDRRDLWIGTLHPRFSGEALRAIRLSPWRDTRGSLLRWSGLVPPEEDEGKPRLVLDRAVRGRDQTRLTVRWHTEPDQLAKGSIEYRVSVVAGDEELAEQVVTHKDRQPQQAAFGFDDFEDLDEDAKFEAYILVTALAMDDIESQRTEEFVLEFGSASAKTVAGSGRVVRTLVDGAVAIPSRAAFEESVSGGHLPPRAIEDKKGFIIWKGDGSRSVRIVRPGLIKRVEEDWATRAGPVGRWVQRVRPDGSPESDLEFIALEPGTCEPATWKRAADASARLAGDLGQFGLLARVQGPKWRAGDDYLNAWAAVLETGAPDLTLHGTVEVRSLAGKPIGMIVTPLHPLRLAWHALYDVVAAHSRYEEGLSAPAVLKALKSVDSAHFPMALPGSSGVRGYAFGDMLGFHAVAMVQDGEPEPKAAVALLSACLGSERQAVAPSIGGESAVVLAREIQHYLDCHEGAGGERPNLLNLQAWRPGDGATVARALGAVLQRSSASTVTDEESTDEQTPLCFTLDLYHPASSGASGRFLSDVGRRRRSGGGGLLEPGDRWMTETAARPGGILVPRLRWAKRDENAASGASHLSLAFDVFNAQLEVRPISSLGATRPLHVFGLSKAFERRVQLDGEPEWTVFGPPIISGEKAPDNRTASDRMLRIDAAVAQATARALGGTRDDWPVLVTRLPEKARAWVDRLHERSDWVITIDRNACVEYFDAPQRLPDVYERFVIDAVPERADLGALQLVTSTSNIDAVRDLVDRALGDMGLSSSERNCRFLIGQLKALSGRLAIRLANAAGGTGELIALALMHANCANDSRDGDTGPWLDLTQGFLIPVDELTDVDPVFAFDETGGARRADFIHVQAPGRGPLEFRFVEVKHRLHLRTARQPDLLTGILKQTGDLRARWHDWFFSSKLAPIERAVRRSHLARLLHFYAERASRHCLSAKAFERLRTEIDQLVIKERYRPAEVECPDRGYIFCPEQRAAWPEALAVAEGSEHGSIWLFGPALLPEERSESQTQETFEGGGDGSALEAPVATQDGSDKSSTSDAGPDEKKSDVDLPGALSKVITPESESSPVDVVLGTTSGGTQEVEWRVSIRANPHLMLVGLPGMGKTTSLINICRQFTGAGVTPIVFSYHDDIDEKLGEAIGPLNFVNYDGLGFNPLRIDDPQPRAHVEVAGTLRDIFASIFPELGDIQLEELRQAIKQSYDDLGWGGAGVSRAETPAFRTFFDLLVARTKPNQNLLARLRELSDYGFFDGSGERASLLTEGRPTVVRVHGTTNGMLQNAFSSFVLYSLYKDMFRRGVQTHLTHVVVFDEAHRAARLKLIPQLAKECRKFGLSLTLASQEAKDFNPALFSAVGSYLVLRVTEADARVLARMTSASDQEKRVADRLKGLERYTGLFFTEGRNRPALVNLQA